MLKIRRPLGRLIFNMGIAIPGKTVFLIETAPWLPLLIYDTIVRRVGCEGTLAVVRMRIIGLGWRITNRAKWANRGLDLEETQIEAERTAIIYCVLYPGQNCVLFKKMLHNLNINRLVQERCNSIANALSYVFLALTHRYDIINAVLFTKLIELHRGLMFALMRICLFAKY